MSVFRSAVVGKFQATLLLMAAISFPQTIPRTEFTTLTGQSVSLPKVGSKKPLLLMLSFSHKASNDAAKWNTSFKVPYASDRRVEYYELADFQGVPPFVMRMILHGMRRSLHEPERSHFAPFYADEDKWKKLVGFDDPDIAYLVLANDKGDVLWQKHGPASEAKAAELENALTKALLKPESPVGST